MNNLLKKLLRLYNFFLVTALMAFGLVSAKSIGEYLSVILLLGIEINFVIQYFRNFIKIRKNILTTILTIFRIYSLLASWTIFIVILLGLKNQSGFISLLFFVPLIFDISSSTFKQLKHRKKNIRLIHEAEQGTVVSPDFQIEKRKLLKLFAGTSAGLLLLYLFNPKKANAAFFGSIPGPGTVAIKDAAGTVVDPATKNPTDGYGIADVDESTTTHYYGFIHYNSTDWYIFRESSGVYTYASKINNSASSYDTAWANRTGSLIFGPYNEAF